jgi:hypothetical protein
VPVRRLRYNDPEMPLRWLCVAMLSVACGCSRNRLPENPVNTQLTDRVDLTGDGKPETITLFLKAASYKTPVLWSLVIDSDGQTLWESDSDDTEIDTIFSDREALPGCPDYPTCKNQYYFHSIMENLVIRDYDPEDVLDMTRGGKLNPATVQYLSQCCSLSLPVVDKAVKDLEQRLREKKAVLIAIPISPVAVGPRMVWVPEANQFVALESE